jgi:hypothetical protein
MEKKITKNGAEFIESLLTFEKVEKGTYRFGSLRFVGEFLNGKPGHENDYRVFMYTHMKSMRNKYGYSLGYGEEFTGVYAAALSEAVSSLGDRFPDFEEFKTNRKVQLSTMKYIKTELRKTLYVESNPNSLQTRNGDTNVFIHADSVSLDAVKEAYQKNDGEFELSDDNRLFGRDIAEDEYHQFSYYVEHFLRHKERILTKKQLDFYLAMKDAYVPSNGVVTKKKAFQAVGYSVPAFNKYKLNIKKRMQQDFSRYGKKKATNADTREKLVRVLNNFIEVADSDENIKNMQVNLTRIVQDNYENESFEVIITKGLEVADKINIVRAVKGKEYISNKVLYKVYDNIFTYLDENELIEVEASEAESTYSEAIFTKAQKADKSTHYRINASGVAVPVSFKDIVEEDVV